MGCRRECEKIVRAKGSGFAVRLCLLVASKGIPVKSHQHDGSNMRGTRMVPTRYHAKLDGEEYTKNYWQLSKAGNGEMVLPREEHTSCSVLNSQP